MIEHDRILARVEIVDGVVADARRLEVERVNAVACRYHIADRVCRRD